MPDSNPFVPPPTSRRRRPPPKSSKKTTAIVLGAIFHVGAIAILLWILFGRSKPTPEPEPVRHDIAAVTTPTGRSNPRVTPLTKAVDPTPEGELPIALPPNGSVPLNLSPPNPPPPPVAGGPLPARLAPLVREFEGKQAGPVNALVVLPSGKHLLSAAADRRLHLWDTTAGREVKLFDGTPTDVRSLAVNYLGSAAVSGGELGDVRIWDLALGREAFALSGHRGLVRGVAFSPNSQYVLSGGDDGTVRVWDVSTREAVRGLKLGQPVTCVAFHPDGRRALAGGDHGTVFILDLEAGTTVHTLGGHLGTVHSVAFSPDGRQAVSVGEDKTMRFWEVATGGRVKIGGPTGRGTFTHIRFRQPLKSVCFAGDGTWVVATGTDSALTVATVDGRSRTSLTLPAVRGMVTALAVAPDSNGVILGTSQGAIERMDFQGGTTAVATTAGPGPDDPTTPATAPAPAPSATPAVPTVTPTWTADAGGSMVRTLAVSAGGRVVTGGTDRTVRVWEPDGKEANTFAHMAGMANNVAISRDGSTILVGGSTPELVSRINVGSDCLLRAITLKGNRVVKVGAQLTPITALALAANGRAALTGSEHVVRYWDAASAREIRQYVGHTGVVRALDFHPKLQQAVSVAADNTARIWDLGGTRLLRTILGIPGTPQGVAFSPDGKSILVYGPGVLGTWDAVTGKQLQSFETPTKGRRRTRTVNLTSDVSAAWAPNGAIVTAVAGAVTLHDPETWDEVLQFSAPPAFVYAVGVSPDGRTVAAAGRGLVAWNLDKPLVPAAPEPPAAPPKETPPVDKAGR